MLHPRDRTRATGAREWNCGSQAEALGGYLEAVSESPAADSQPPDGARSRPTLRIASTGRGTGLALDRAMTEDPRLRYIDAGHVEGRADDLSGFDVVTWTGRKLGALDGLIVDPPERQIKYFVVYDGGFGRRRLVPVSSARLDLDRRAVEVDLEADDDCPAFDARTFPRFSDEDVLSAMFRRAISIH